MAISVHCNNKMFTQTGSFGIDFYKSNKTLVCQMVRSFKLVLFGPKIKKKKNLLRV